MARAKRVLTVFYRHRRGGHCRRLYMMCEALLAAGYEVHYVAAEKLKLDDHENLHPHILHLPVKRFEGFWFWLWFTALAPWMIFWKTLTLRPRVLALFDTYYSLISSAASLLTLTPIMLFMRAVPMRMQTVVESSWLRRTTMQFVDYCGLFAARTIVSVTSTMQDEMVAHTPSLQKKFVTLPYSVLFPAGVSLGPGEIVDSSTWGEWIEEKSSRRTEIAMRYDLSPESIILTTTGELNIRKNVEHLIRALGACKSEELQLIICGDGPERKNIHALIVGLGLTKRVVLAGWVDNLHEVIACSDLFVLPSQHDGMANSILEALGAGVPVMAANTTEMREVLKYDELLFHPTHVGDFAKKLDILATTKRAFESLKDLSRERTRLYVFDWGKRVVELIERQSSKEGETDS